ncbi:carbonate dehydratase [Corticibacter populi]|uniref:Carbonic anhydrase n=1 Tax=Corticibacter populi TaxID=1550736 RepID=A0A3M6QS16_9BURK|nr:carbonate dehydratase [Corticibacter populi]RMX05641.1 carbonate dehydratase [Corticibacter populi]RZS31083.1 carbonic anhydrase [Corticibacter populi]
MPTLKQLFENNRNWAATVEREKPGFFTRLQAQQNPKYMWIGCSDSRVPANQITGLDPGEVFVHRNVANVVVPTDLNCLSTIQYAVDQLKIEHLMVVGHYGCGGVYAALNDQRAGLVDNWLRHVKDVRDRHRGILDQIPAEQRHAALCELNAIEQVVNVAHTTVVQDAWDQGQKLILHGWCYHLTNGLITDLEMTITGKDALAPSYARALERVAEVNRTPSPD